MSYSSNSAKNGINLYETSEDQPILFRNPASEAASFEEVQDRVARRTAKARRSPLVLLRPGAAIPPLFIVTGLSGAATDVIQLGREMQCRQPVYAVQARGLDGAEPPLESVEAIAQYSLAAVRERQPEGPYILIGYSFGGLVAFEMAQMLTRAGEQPALLVLLESYVHPQYWPLLVRLATVKRIAKHRAVTLARSPPGESIAYFAERVRSIARCMRPNRQEGDQPAFRWFYPSPPEGTSLEGQQVFAASVVAFRQYIPQPYAGRVVFFQPRNYGNYPEDPRRMWRDLTVELEVQNVSGDHLSMVREHAEDLGARLSWCVEKVLGGVERR